MKKRMKKTALNPDPQTMFDQRFRLEEPEEEPPELPLEELPLEMEDFVEEGEEERRPMLLPELLFPERIRIFPVLLLLRFELIPFSFQ